MTSPAVAPAVVRLGVVDSTQTVAFALAAAGAPDRTVVVAEFQAAGRGRRGRVWEAEAGTSLLASILVRPRLAISLLPTLSLAAGVAVVEALAAAARLAVRLKWPNDVVVDGRKLAGILLETRLAAGPIGAAPSTNTPVVAVGVGVNLRQRAFPPPLTGRATSVLLETGRLVERDVVLAALLDAFDRWRGRLEGDGFAPIHERWLALNDTLGRMVAFEGGAGVAEDLDGEGALLVREGATLRRLRAGEASEGREAAPAARADAAGD